MCEINNCIRLVFTGDISFSEHFINCWQNDGCLSDEVKKYLKASDYVIANLESPISEQEISSNRQLNHRSPAGAGRYLADNNIRVWNLANNHITDCGDEGLLDTLYYAEKNSCQTIGAGKNLHEASEAIILGDKIKVGVLSVARPWGFLKSNENKPGAFTWEKKELFTKKIAELRRKADYIVVVVHGGDEFCNIPMPYIRDRYIDFLNIGADIIVAHHPHVVQNYEMIGNKVIFYSLGNFIFDTDNQRDFAHTDVGELVGINFTRSGFAHDSLAIKINRNNHTVDVGTEPAIFRNIDEKEYKNIWPLAAQSFYPVYLKKRLKFDSKLSKMSKSRFLVNELQSCIHKRERIILLGRIISLFGRWKKFEAKEVIDYLQELV